MQITHIFSMAAIAVVTSISTVSVTNYLLSQRWCIRDVGNGRLSIAYNPNGCTISPTASRHFFHTLGYDTQPGRYLPLSTEELGPRKGLR